MAEFRYKAKESNGNIISATIAAITKEEAIDRICKKGLYPISVLEMRGNNGGNKKASLFSEIAAKSHVTYFTRQLAGLLKSGISVLKGISIIGQQNENAAFCEALNRVESGIKDGRSLSEMLQEHPRLFNQFYISMVRVGEENGTLPEVLLRLADYRRRREEISSKVKNALTYPAVVALVGIFTIVFIMTNVLPKLVELIKGLGMELPGITVMLINMVTFMEKYFGCMVIAVIVFLVAFVKLSRNTNVRLAIDRIKLRLPIFGRVLLESELIGFAQTLRASLDSGLQLLRSIELSQSVLTNEVMKAELAKYYNYVKSGLSLGDMMRESHVFPSMVSNMIAIGESSGSLIGALDQIADDYQWRINDTVSRLVTLLEPIIIIFIGGIVAFIVMALLLPIFSIDIV